MPVLTDRVPLNALRVFEAVASHLSFTAAARELGVTTAAVSAQIKSLEADIGVPLFRRHTRAVALTQEGSELLPGVRRGLDELRRAVERIRRERVGGMLNLSVPNEFLQRWLLPRLAEFTRQHPEIEVRFGPSRVALDFDRDDFHAAILYGPGAWPGLKTERLLDEWVFPVCSPALLARLGPIETLGGFLALSVVAQPFRAVAGLAASRRWRHDPVGHLAADGRYGCGPGRRRTGQGRSTRALVARGRGHRRGSAGTADVTECPTAQRLVSRGPAGELFAAEGRALSRLAARMLQGVSAADGRDAARRVGEALLVSGLQIL